MKFRHEYKHLINYSDMLRLRGSLSAVAKHDSHCGADGTYLVTSLYFDNYMDKALREKEDGLLRREKFRIRRYGDDLSFLRIEKKSKYGTLCSKESALITREECQRLLGGDSSFLAEGEDALRHDLYAKMRYQLLRPKAVVAYRRESFVFPAGNVRVTLDFDIRGSDRPDAFLDPSLPLAKRCAARLVEVKWDEYLPRIIADAVQMKNRRASAFSKYAAIRF